MTAAAERATLIASYAAGPARLRAALDNAPVIEALAWRPAPDEWSAHEIAVHCADSEMNAALRIRYLVAEREPVIQGYDETGWAAAMDYQAHPLTVALAVVDAVRAHTVPVIRALPEAAWARRGTHTESGTYGAEDWLRIYAAHLEEHAAQIERALARWPGAR
ncbi:MAG: DinB family protein [Chloroflexi bacterium]|nr:DinB family protein [Chloroflexota bacterium]